MSFGNSIAIKAVCGTATVGGVSGVGYYGYLNEWHKKIFFSDDTTKSVFIVEITEKPTNLPNVDLYSEANDSQKNFSCSLTTDKDKKDDTCKIFSLNFNDKNFLNLNDLLKTDTEVKKQTSLTQNSFYKLEVNNKNLFDLTTEKSSINIQHKTSTTNNVYAKLKIIADTKNENNTSVANTFILTKGKADVSHNVAITNNQFKCKVGPNSAQHEVECKVYELGDSITTEEQMTFKNVSVITNLNKIKKEKYYLIDFTSTTDNSSKISNENIANTIVYKNWDNTKTGELIFQSKIVGKFDSTNKANNKLFLLKK